MDSKQAVTALAALAQTSRLALFRWLVQVGPEGDCPGTMSERLAIPAATLSFHLKALQHAGLIEATQSGRFIRYSANFVAMQALIDYLGENCCGGQVDRCPPTSGPICGKTGGER